jgi:DNA polymerase I-like protein with 3'-5' exonuclease and polymerase domains
MTKFCVLDLETNIGDGPHGPSAKDPNNDFFTVIAGNTINNVHIMHKSSGFKRKLPAFAVKLLNEADVIIGHNLPFDLSYIYHTSEFQDFLKRGGQIWDTQVAEYLMSGQRHSFASLAELQLIYLNKKIKESRISALFAKGIGADKIVARAPTHKRLFALYEKYALSDGITTLQIFQKQFVKAKSLNILDVIKLYNNYLLTLTVVMNTGIPVDLEKCQKTLRDFKLKSVTYLEEATNLISNLWDVRLGTFNVNSPKDKSAILFGGVYKLKEKEPAGFYKNGNQKFTTVEKDVVIEGFKVPTSITKESAIKGRYATGADILEKIVRKTKNDVLRNYCEYQKQSMNYGKMCSTYLEPFLNLSVNGLLFPNYNNTMTITSRLSSSKPNLQNVPSKGDMLAPIQGQLIAPKGWTAISADYSQLEIYVSAYLANDPALTNDLLSGIDFHVKRLSYAEDMSYNEVYNLCKVEKLPEWDDKRTKAKTISYQKAYGASPKSLSITTGLDEDLIKKIFEREDIEYPQVALFNKSVLEQVNNSKELSQAKHLPKMKKGGGKDGKRFVCGMELLPIISNDGNIHYDNDEYRYVGYYTAATGKRYSFEEIGRVNWRGELKRGFSTTQTKNYHIQGTASDVQASSSAALLPLLIKNSDKVKMVNEIHDSKWFLVKDEYLDKMLVIIKELMENVPANFKKYLNVEMPFRIPIDFKIGKNFAEMKPYEVKL